MLSEDALRRALAGAGCSAPVRFDEVTGSTNDTALAMAEAGAPEWTLVAAGHQTSGRGRLGRRWVDRPGAALLFSVVLRPVGLAPAAAGLIPLLGGVAAAEACRQAGGPVCRCRWPNDLVVGEAKVGGLLAESRLEGGRLRHVVLGVGINLGEVAPEVPGGPAVATVGDVDAEELLGAFLRSFRARYAPADPGFPAAVLAAHRKVSATLGRRVRATTVEGRTVEGRAIDLDEAGGLVLEVEGERRVVAFGEVAHLEP